MLQQARERRRLLYRGTGGDASQGGAERRGEIGAEPGEARRVGFIMFARR